MASRGRVINLPVSMIHTPANHICMMTDSPKIACFVKMLLNVVPPTSVRYCDVVTLFYSATASQRPFTALNGQPTASQHRTLCQTYARSTRVQCRMPPTMSSPMWLWLLLLCLWLWLWQRLLQSPELGPVASGATFSCTTLAHELHEWCV